MLKSRNLDDQTYAQIVEAAEGRLPWLCPVWTDHNAHDPGITVLELMAWYKEMQQYHLNQFTDALRCKLLKLAGVSPRPAAAAVCTVELDADAPARLELARLRTQEGIPFELAEPVPARRPRLARVCVARGTERMDVGELLGGRRMTFQPFGGGRAERSCLRVGFSALGEGPLRLWFDVEEPSGAPRNPFESPEQAPRVLRWAAGERTLEVLLDETHALSRSGCVTLDRPEEWPAGEDGLYWLTVSLENAGCEESVRLSGVFTGRYRAVQRETWAKSHCFRAQAAPDWQTELTDAQAREAELAVFLRQEDGWVQTADWQAAPTEAGRLIRTDTTRTAQDGADNVRIVTLDPARAGRLLFDAKGLPGETFFLDLEGRTVLTDTFALLCETLERDGAVRPALWRCVDDLSQCGPRDRAFTYDPVRETVTFGDGEHGALLRRGTGAVLAADMTLSCGSGGNIPAGGQLRFDGDGACVRCGAAEGGADRETVLQAQERLARRLENSRKCVSAADYERLARQTPGLRVAAARALPAYDPEEPTGVSRTPTVTVVVIPGGGGERPMPDARFLAAVQRWLDGLRPIGTRVLAVPPVYADISVSASVICDGAADEALLADRLRAYFAEKSGGTIRTEEAAALIQALPGVLRVKEVELRALGGGCRQDRSGEIRLPGQTVPCLGRLRLERLPAEWDGAAGRR